MSEVSAKSFLGLLQKSGICDTAELKATLAELSRKASGKPVKLDQLTGHLLESGLISEWHVRKLLAGKYKGFFLGKYRLLQHLGTGGMSTVYLAQHTLFNQQRAIKVLPRDRVADKTYLERFFREGRAAASLNHKNIVRVYDIDNAGDTYYLVMEYVRGQDICELVKQGGPLPFDKAIDWLVQALTGLQHAHDNDLVHRDIKPANLLVTPEGEVKILDLGLALFQEDDSSLTVMHDERVLGTADYLSPEQAVDSHNLDHRADIYSSGCTLYYMLTGKPPFHEGTLAQRIAMHQTREPEHIHDFRSDCPDELVSIVTKMMKKEPDERYQSCTAVAADLRRAGESLLTGGRQVVSVKKQSAASASANAGAPAAGRTPDRAADRAPDQRPASQPKTGTPRRSQNQPAPPAEKAKQAAGPAKKVAAAPATRSTRQQTAARQPTPEVNGEAASPGPPPARPGKAKPVPAAKRGVAREKAAADQKVASPGRLAATAAKQKQTQQQKKRSGSPGKLSGNAPAAPVVVPGEATPKPQVGKRELDRFVTANRSTRRPSARPVRKPVRNQLLVVVMVFGMLALLGITLLLAMWLVTPPDKDKDKQGQLRSLPVAPAGNPLLAERLIPRPEPVPSRGRAGSLFIG